MSDVTPYLFIQLFLVEFRVFYMTYVICVDL